MNPLIALTAALTPALTSASDAQEVRAFASEQALVAMELYRQLDDAPGNLAFSPLSIARALALVRSGAQGATAAELDRVLRLPPERSAEMFQALRAILVAREAGESAPRLASALFVNSRRALSRSFSERAKTFFASEVSSLDFARADEASQAINAWVAAVTQGRVPAIVNSADLDATTPMIIADTIHLRCAWWDEFDVRSTRAGRFLKADDTYVAADFLRSERRVRLGETKGARVLELYLQGGQTSMVFVLPELGTSLGALVERESIEQWTQSLRPALVALELPKFRFEFGADMTKPLERMGLSHVFAPGAELDEMGIPQLFVGKVLHRVTISVGEKGIEAAAATALAVLCGSSMKPEQARRFVADRPFLFFVRHNATGAVLFLGRVDDPLAN